MFFDTRLLLHFYNQMVKWVSELIGEYNGDYALCIFTLKTFSVEWIISAICVVSVLLFVWHLEQVRKVLKWS
jgi:hypothetical protein